MRTSYDEFWDYIDKNNKETLAEDAMFIGNIINIQPLQIKIDDLVLGESKLKINPYLKEWTEEVNAHTTENSLHSHSISTITHPSKLKIGKQVFCYGYEYNEDSKSYQKYIILAIIE